MENDFKQLANCTWAAAGSMNYVGPGKPITNQPGVGKTAVAKTQSEWKMSAQFQYLIYIYFYYYFESIFFCVCFFFVEAKSSSIKRRARLGNCFGMQPTFTWARAEGLNV